MWRCVSVNVAFGSQVTWCIEVKQKNERECEPSKNPEGETSRDTFDPESVRRCAMFREVTAV